jgi:hypothetical protein
MDIFTSVWPETVFFIACPSECNLKEIIKTQTTLWTTTERGVPKQSRVEDIQPTSQKSDGLRKLNGFIFTEA